MSAASARTPPTSEAGANPRTVSRPESAPRLALTMGDPAGVGLEIVLKSPGSKARPGGAVVVYPPFEALRDGARRLGLPGPDEHGVDIVRDGRADAGSLIEAMSLGASLAQYRARAERALQGGP